MGRRFVGPCQYINRCSLRRCFVTIFICCLHRWRHCKTWDFWFMLSHTGYISWLHFVCWWYFIVICIHCWYHAKNAWYLCWYHAKNAWYLCWYYAKNAWYLWYVARSLDMCFNVKKSVALRISSHYNVQCTPLVLNCTKVGFTTSLKYLGIVFKSGIRFSCSYDHLKISFYRAFNLIIFILKARRPVLSWLAYFCWRLLHTYY